MPGPAWLLLLVALALLAAGAACGSPAPAACPEEPSPAVELAVVDESGEPLLGASLRYRMDGGQWQDWPENLGRRTVIRGQPGQVQLEVSRQGFAGAARMLEIPAAADDRCQPVVQQVTLQLARTPCPEPPAALNLTIEPPLDALQASVLAPASGRQQLACQEADGDACGRFAIEVVEPGSYAVSLEELPGLGPMQVISDVVAYDPPAVTLGLEHRGATGTAAVGGATSVKVTIPVRLDEANCPLADFQSLETFYPPDDLAGEGQGRPPLALVYQGNLLMTNPGAEGCQAEPALTALPFRATLPAGTDLDDVQVQVDYGAGWQAGACDFSDGRYLCQVVAPNPLLNRPFVVRIVAGGEEAIGFSLPFSGMCLVFQ